MVGKGLLLTIPNNAGIITAFNTLVLDNIQGSPKVDLSSTFSTLVLGGSSILNGGTVQFASTLNDGLHFRVKHGNHIMSLDWIESNSLVLKVM